MPLLRKRRLRNGVIPVMLTAPLHGHSVLCPQHLQSVPYRLYANTDRLDQLAFGE